MKGLIKGRKVAELITFTVSLGILALVAVALIKDTVQGTGTEFVELSVHAQRGQRVGSTFVVPVVLKNESKRTVVSAKFEVQMDGAEAQEIEVDYLGAESQRTVYRVFEKEGPIRATPIEYQLE